MENPTAPPAQVALSYESPYIADPTPNPTANTLKRRVSEDAAETGAGDEKRQRLENAVQDADFDIDALLQDATSQGLSAYAEAPSSNVAALIVQNTMDVPVATTETGNTFIDPGNSRQPQEDEFSLLDDACMRVIVSLAQCPESQRSKIVTEPRSELCRTYTTMKGLFDNIKRIVRGQDNDNTSVFLHLNKMDSNFGPRRVIKHANYVTFIASLYGNEIVDFYQLNSNFIDSFCNGEGRLNRETGAILESLKFQAYIVAASQEDPDRTKEQLVEDFFPEDFDSVLLEQHPELSLNVDETQLVQMIKKRRDFLLRERDDPAAIAALGDKYPWSDFLMGIDKHLHNVHLAISSTINPRHTLFPSRAVESLGMKTETEDDGLDKLLQEAVQEAEASAREAPNAMLYAPPNNALGISQHPHRPPQFQQNGHVQPYALPGSALGANSQNAPTQMLYEQARQVAITKNHSQAKRPGLPSQRRPWSNEEENALMAGLDQLKGPHWSGILALYGENGTVSNVLAHRNQVQLKDKARNLKLFFLKSNIDVPFYLKGVTGELKTRAPSQAARKELEEKQRTTIENQAHYGGLTALMNLRQGQVQQASHHVGPSPAAPQQNAPSQGPLPPQQQARRSPQSRRSPQTASAGLTSAAPTATAVPSGNEFQGLADRLQESIAEHDQKSRSPSTS